MSIPFKVIIPVRFASSRLPGKPLLMIGNRSLLEHVYLSAAGSRAQKIIIATDDDRIEDAARSFGATVVMTNPAHQSGTDRIYEVLDRLGIGDDEIIVNVQGDEYGLQSELIDCVAELLHGNPRSAVATLCEEITDYNVYRDPNSVKVVMSSDGSALYFSRSPIPWRQSGHAGAPGKAYGPAAFKHIGIYAYRSGFLRTFSSLARPAIEREESLEQLRILYHGYRVQVEVVQKKEGVEINTEEDLIRARKAVGPRREYEA